MKKYLDLIRIKHWIKNILIFVPMICGKVLNKDNLYICILGSISFCFISSFIYIVNDIKDIDKDRLHDRKKYRPLASGIISKRLAVVIGIILMVMGIIINYIVTSSLLNISFYLLVGYLIINILYSYYLKNIVIIDVFLLSLGFILRVYYGASLIDIEVSNWLFLTIMCGSLFLGLGKRKKELISNSKVRDCLSSYNEIFLDKFQYVSLTLMVVFYSLWSISHDSSYLVFTVPVIMILFMRYCLIMENKTEGDPVTILYSDKALMFLCLIYMAMMVVFLLIL